MKHSIGTIVKVVDSADDTVCTDLIGKVGEVIRYNSNGMTGNYDEDPLHVVYFGEENFHAMESFWYEELSLINK